jgi:hypothetical protein
LSRSNISEYTFFDSFFLPVARPRVVTLPRKSVLSRLPQLASLLLIDPTHPSRSAVLVDQKVPATGNPVRSPALLASLSSRVTLFPRVVLPHYQASQLKISSTTNFNGGYSTSVQSSMVLQKSFLYVGPINQYGNTSKSSQKATPSLVIAQSYQMGPSSKVDPLSMLNEAKRICDQLVCFNLTTYPPLI